MIQLKWTFWVLIVTDMTHWYDLLIYEGNHITSSIRCKKCGKEFFLKYQFEKKENK